MLLIYESSASGKQPEKYRSAKLTTVIYETEKHRKGTKIEDVMAVIKLS